MKHFSINAVLTFKSKPNYNIPVGVYHCPQLYPCPAYLMQTAL